MSDERRLFIPLFYNTLEITECLTDGEFGALIRELLRSGGKREYKPKLPTGLTVAYNFMLDNAQRIFSLKLIRDAEGACAPKKRGQKSSINSLDAFEKALERTDTKKDGGE